MKTNKRLEFIYWFSFYNTDSPSVRYRAKYPLDYFKKYKGVESYLVIPGYSPQLILFFLKSYFSALFFRRRNSLIIVQRVSSNFIYANLLKLLVLVRSKNSVYDLDDADYLESDSKTIYYFAGHCEKISAGSKLIESHLKKYNQHIFHTTSPVMDLSLSKKNKNSIFTVGWIGGFGGDQKKSMIEFVFPALKKLTFNFNLKILGVYDLSDKKFILQYFEENKNIKIELPMVIDWNDERGIQNRILDFDIGIATLTNDELQLSKSGIKAKQYLNNGIPVLSSNMPENNSVIVDGFNGYYCSDEIDYFNKLNQFYAMSNEDYLIFSVNARNSINSFNHSKYYSDFEKIFSSKLDNFL